MSTLDGRVAVISGGARGQGRQHAITLAQHGADIAIIDAPAGLDNVPYPLGTVEDMTETVKLVEAEGRRCLAFQGDVRDHEAMAGIAAEIFNTFGRIDIALANAGIASGGGSALDLTAEAWREVIDVNLSGTWYFCQAQIPCIIRGGRGGSVVITSSAAGLRGGPGWVHYTASKHAVVGLMRALAHELAPHNIRINTIHPTGVATPMILNPWFQELAARSPELKRTTNLLDVELLDPVDISNAILWLVSDEARYITGVTLPVDAGTLVR
jgi:SDR family mycofactocin-dependent oxidoreductase